LLDLRSLVNGVRRAVRYGLRGVTTATMSFGVVVLLLNTACYTYDLRSAGEIPRGQQVVVTVNNVGRVALTADLGDDVATAEGDLIANDTAGVHMRVTNVEYLSGESSRMPGVAVTIPTNAFVTVATKQFSRSKTVAAVVGLGALLVAAIKAFSLIGSGNGDSGSKPAPPPGTT
jgi:hypothetical protein